MLSWLPGRIVAIYETFLEAVIEFVKIWKLSIVYKGFQLFGRVMMHCCGKWFLAFQRVLKGTHSFEMSGSTR
jgi:hypothetical protein